MANWWMPREKLGEDGKGSGRFDMTVGSDEDSRGMAHAVGYCQGWREFTDEECDRISKRAGPHVLQMIKKTWEEYLPFKAKFHTDGHATKEEASNCFHEYLLDLCMEFRDDPESQKKCKVCGEWTQGLVMFKGEGGSGYFATLCKTHQTREHVKQCFWPAKTCERCKGTGKKPLAYEDEYGVVKTDYAKNVACERCDGKGKV